MLNKTELRKLIRAHNILSKIKIPPRSTADDMVQLIENAGYSVDHEKKEISPKPTRGRKIKIGESVKGRGRSGGVMGTDDIIPKPKSKELSALKKEEKKAEKEQEEKKKAREIRKKAVADERARQKKKAEPKKKSSSMGTQTEKPKPKKKEEILKIEDKKGKVKEAVEKIEKKEKDFKVNRFERSQMLRKLKEEYGTSFNPYKILQITAKEETPELVKKKCRQLRLKNHPDKGGDKKTFDLIQKACDLLLKTQVKRLN